MDRRVTPPKRVTSPTWGPSPPCKQAVRHFSYFKQKKEENLTSFKYYKGYQVVNKFSPKTILVNSPQMLDQERWDFIYSHSMG